MTETKFLHQGDLFPVLTVNLPAGRTLGLPDATAIADATGALVSRDPLFLQSTGFVLDPHGRDIVSVYSGGAIGRVVPQDVVGLVRYLREHDPARQSR